MPRSAVFIRLVAALVLIAALGAPASAQLQIGIPLTTVKLDPILQLRTTLTGRSRVIVRAVNASSLGLVTSLIRQLGGTLGHPLPIISSQAADVPNTALSTLAAFPFVARVSLDRVIAGAMERTGGTVGATAIRQSIGYDGNGIGVVVIDSGVTSWHDDLSNPAGDAQRVDRFVDFVNGHSLPYDDYGHGTHVTGIIAGNGFDSSGARSGIAPASRVMVLKALDEFGRGRISNVIAALGYAVDHKDTFNIRVANLSIAAAVYESYNTDPLTLAARRAVAAGIVVVAAAGNNGRGPDGGTRYGGVTAPGNAPWVLTVGASSHMGSIDRVDDTIAAFSSRGPGAGGWAAKPDVVAPGVGIESLSDPNSRLYATKSAYLLNGTVPTPYLPYLSQSGTSMSTPVVSGTVALMLQANPGLTPNQVKAILQYTAEVHPAYDSLTQGAGFVSAQGAVELARYLASPSSAPYPSSPAWSTRLIWGNHVVEGGRLTADANAWGRTVTWGAATTPDGQNVEWGVICSGSDCDSGDGTWNRWGTTCSDATCNVTWADAPNVVWGLLCGGLDCLIPWTSGAVFGTNDTDTVVWGMNDGDTVVWGMTCDDPSCEPVIWSSQ